MNTESTENTPLIKAIEEKLVSIEDELSILFAVRADQGESVEIVERLGLLVKSRGVYQQALAVEKQRSVFKIEGPGENQALH